MLSDRNKVLHLYDQQSARDTAQRVLDQYIPAFRVLALEADRVLGD